MVYVTAVGARAWFHPDAALIAASRTMLGRSIEPQSVGEHLSHVLLGSNVLWDIPMGFLSESLRVRSNARLMFMHHAAVVLLSYLTIALPFFQYYSVFFFGVIEISSAPMALMDLCHPRNVGWSKLAQSNATLKAFNAASRAVFALTYMLVRALYFPYVMAVGVVPDLLELLGAAEPPVPKWVVTIFLVSAGLLTALQLYWAKLLVDAATGGGGSGAGTKKAS
mgnify:CR=1 FL=1